MSEAASSETRLELKVKKQFRSRAHSFALDAEISLAVEIVVLFGASGAGKTTLLECIAGLLTPDDGAIVLTTPRGQAIMFSSRDRVTLAPQQRHVGYLFQTPTLFPHMTAEENVGYGLRAINRVERSRLIVEAMQTFRISHVADRRPDAISGGERQRVALARALVTRPHLLLLDEPLSALDQETKASILCDLQEWHASHPVPVLYVTHAIDEAFTIAKRVIKMDNGKIVAEGEAAGILQSEREQLLEKLQPSRVG